MDSSPGHAVGTPASLSSLSIDPEPIIRSGRRNWTRWLGSIISLAIFAGALSQWQRLDFHELLVLFPASIAFWMIYVVYYFIGPVSEWVIFRRLWHLPLTGILPLLRKRLSNELVLGYLGEVYFYTWARRNTQLTAAPFGAIKDVAILSAMAGNAITLLMLVLGFPVFKGLVTGLDLDLSQKTLAFSIGFIALSSFLVLVLRRHVLSLPRKELTFVMLVHCSRIAAGIVLLALMWHLALPDVPLLWWFLLSLLRQLVSRLPFLPNKDVIFASLAIFFVGEEKAIVGLLALVAGLVLVSHLAIGVLLALLELRRSVRSERGGGLHA